MIVTYKQNISNAVNMYGGHRMEIARAVELSLVVLKTYDQEDYLEQIYEIYNCICNDHIYEDEPRLCRNELVRILENLTVNSRHSAKSSLNSVLYGNTSESEKTRVAGLLEKILFSEDED